MTKFGDAAGHGAAPAEHIAEGSSITLWVSDFGVTSVALCKDYNDTAGHAATWLKLGLDLVLVPSMGGKTNVSAHIRQADAMWNVASRAVSVVANQENALETAAPGFVRAAVAHPPAADKHPPKAGGSLVVFAQPPTPC